MANPPILPAGLTWPLAIRFSLAQRGLPGPERSFFLGRAYAIYFHESRPAAELTAYVAGQLPPHGLGQHVPIKLKNEQSVFDFTHAPGPFRVSC